MYLIMPKAIRFRTRHEMSQANDLLRLITML